MKYKKVIFDLDDTLVPTHANPQWKDGDYTNLYFSDNVKSLLETVGREKLILLTFDRYGDQRKKLDHLQVKKYFSEVVIVDEKIKKRQELETFKNKYGNVLVVGDRYNEGELFHAENLGLSTVCVAFPGGTHRKPEEHHKYLLVIKSDDEYIGLINLLDQ